MNEYSKLSSENKKIFKEICDISFGKSFSYDENKQPLYFTDNGNMIDPDYIVLEFIKFIRKEKLIKICKYEN